jgi:hypothetical protein
MAMADFILGRILPIFQIFLQIDIAPGGSEFIVRNLRCPRRL